MKHDFSGYATRFNVKCSDGRTIKPSAFKDMDGKTVPLVWQHNVTSPENVLGHALLEYRPNDGMYAYCSVNGTDRGLHSKEMVAHKDITSLSIYADKLKQMGQDVMHGVIREVSLVMAGANPGAFIDNAVVRHGDGFEELETEATIYGGDDISEASDEDLAHSEGDVKMENENTDDPTVAEIYESMTDEQKQVVGYLVQSALENAAEGDTTDGDESVNHSDTEENTMTRNVFEGEVEDKSTKTTLTHSDIQAIFANAEKAGSLHAAALQHADTYGITNIEELFPDAKMITSLPEFIKRRTEWVNAVISGTNHSPFSRIKSMQADITADAARAKGYLKGNLKKEEFFNLVKRVTTPTTIYKKQKLDRDDILDITDFDVVAWIKGEMRLMLEEEIARAILIGDGRSVEDPDKISESNIRPIWKEDPLYAPRVEVAPVNGSVTDPLMEAVLRSRTLYEGSGNPVFFTSSDVVSDMLMLRDQQGLRIYKTEAELVTALRVSRIVEVPQFSGLKSDANKPLLGIMVNLKDYTVGADKGGQTTYFEDFDIDYNQHKYLLETRASGALNKIKSAVIFEGAAA